MTLDANTPLSAQAILETAAAAAAAAAQFATLGFDIGTVVANSFSVSAPARVFEMVFRVRLRVTTNGGVEVAPHDPRSTASLELPLDALPPSLRVLLDTVTFTAPPDFGPTRW